MWIEKEKGLWLIRKTTYPSFKSPYDYKAGNMANIRDKYLIRAIIRAIFTKI